jgi:hypothetical protein
MHLHVWYLLRFKTLSCFWHVMITLISVALNLWNGFLIGGFVSWKSDAFGLILNNRRSLMTLNSCGGFHHPA